eukprot:4029592-Pleurochrysis_carterae.AAC.1
MLYGTENGHVGQLFVEPNMMRRGFVIDPVRRYCRDSSCTISGAAAKLREVHCTVPGTAATFLHTSARFRDILLRASRDASVLSDTVAEES